MKYPSEILNKYIAWEDVPEEEKAVVNAWAKENEKNIRLWSIFCHTKRCLFCRFKFSDGIVIKNPFPNSPKGILDSLQPAFLMHIKTTHGYEPEVLLRAFF